jgi:tetratricopeptide (TPR) repeat protein
MAFRPPGARLACDVLPLPLAKGPMLRPRLGQVCLSLLLIGGAHTEAASGQASPADPLEAAIELRNAGDLPGAVRLLRSRLTERPSDPRAIRLLAQTLYWLKDFDQARAVYDTAISRHGDDIDLRLEYARMLVETRRTSAARSLLEPLLERPDAAARALTLLGTLDYWDGRLTAATRRFQAALKADSTSVDARRQWREIAMITAPWGGTGLEAAHDDQTLDRITPTLHAGVFITPLVSMELRARSDWYRSGDSVSRSVQSGEVSLKGYAPELRLETELSGGLIHRSFGDPGGEWTGRLQGRIRLPSHLSIGGRAERRPYFQTLASLSIPVRVRELTAFAVLDHPSGWLAEASLGRLRYPDGNTQTSGYAWLLAPVLRRPAYALALGYAFSAQDSRESRFVPTLPHPPGTPGFDPSGRYVPYYTPDDVVIHSLIGNFTLHGGRRTTISGNGAWSLSAHEQATGFTTSGPPPAVQPGSFQRAFSPWNARLGVGQDLGKGWSVRGQAEHQETAFYSASAGSIGLSYRFSAAAGRRVDRF